MAESISPMGAQPADFQHSKFKGSFYSSDLSEMKHSLMEECQYLIMDPNQLLGVVQSFQGFLESADPHFQNAYKTLKPHIEDYCTQKNQDPAFKLTPIGKNQIAEAAQQLNNVKINLTPDQFSKGVHNTLINMMNDIEKEAKTPQLFARLTGVVSSLCSLETFSSDPGMNELFFDMSSYTMGELSAVSVSDINASIKALLDAL
ncbi:MAG: hypothetical protein P0S95_05550 [Rhabdochlamydiaceae bacterium]|nr:hypothetical protein [Candidatus Amphrikana amoebophyrae]